MPSVGAVTSGYNTIVVNAAYPNAKANDLILADAGTAPFTVTLPVGAQNNTQIAVKKTDLTSNLVTVAAGTGTTIDLDNSVGLYSTGAAITLVYDSANTMWRLISTGLTNLTGGSILPTGGLINTVLTKNSAANYDVAWLPSAVSAGGLFQPWTSGRSYAAPPASAGFTTGAPAVSTNLGFWQVRIPNACTISSLSVVANNSGFSGYFAYLSLYADNNGSPGARLAGGNTSYNSVAWAPTTVTLNYAAPASTVWVSYGTNYGTGAPLVCHGQASTNSSAVFPNNQLLGGINMFSALNSANPPTALYASSMAYNSTATAVGVTLAPIQTMSPLFMFTVA